MCVACLEPCRSRVGGAVQAAGAYLPVQRRTLSDGSRSAADSSVRRVDLGVAQQRVDGCRPVAAAAAAKVLNPAVSAATAAKRLPMARAELAAVVSANLTVC